jgi:hypothetical protein
VLTELDKLANYPFVALKICSFVFFFWCLFSLSVQGAFLEGRRYAQKLEGIRLGSLILGIMRAPKFWSSVRLGIINLALTYALSSLGLFFSTSYLRAESRFFLRKDSLIIGGRRSVL